MASAPPTIVLAFMAHPDDAEIFCGGSLILLENLGWEVHIATTTPGDCGTMDRNSWDISSVRTQEAATAAKRIGATYHCLDERDGFVVYDKPTIAKTLDLFRRIAPTLVLTHAPRDYMEDHEQASLLARAVSFLYPAPNASTTPLRRSAHVPHLYYCDAMDGTDPLGITLKPTTFIDVSLVHEQKLAMLACHTSQREWLRAHHGIDEYLEGVRRHDSRNGGLRGIKFAEAYVQHRGHAYPQDDLLARLLNKEK